MGDACAGVVSNAHEHKMNNKCDDAVSVKSVGTEV